MVGTDQKHEQLQTVNEQTIIKKADKQQNDDYDDDEGGIFVSSGEED